MDIKKMDLTTPAQKVIAGVILFTVGVIFYFLLPPLVLIFQNLIYLSILSIILLVIAMNYNNIWQYSKQLAWNITKNRISSDKLYYMYKYHEYLLERLANLDKSVGSIIAIRSKLERRLSEVVERHKKNKDLAIQYEKQEQSELVIKTAYRKVQIDQESIDSLIPKVQGVKKQEEYLKQLYNAWASDIEQLKYKLDNKAEEYTLLKEMAEATGNAQEFLKGNSQEYKEFMESMNQIENSVNDYIGTIESFERKVNPIMQNLQAEQSVNEEAGKLLLEEYKKSRIEFGN